MPKDPRNHISVSKTSRKSGVRPYSRQGDGDGSKNAKIAHPSSSSPGREWKGARCSICMDHPHNAVLLLCGSHKKGCRPYVCDTSRRHSNCLGQFRKVFAHKKCPTSISDEESSQSERRTTGMEGLSEILEDLVETPQEEESNVDDGGDQQSEVKELDYPRDSPMRYLDETDGGGGASSAESSEEENKASGLLCPLCRADVKGWKVVSRARHYLNSKVRACAMEGCAFSGTYTQLRRHARHVHPLARPCEVDSERMLAWQRMEDERELGDILSTLREETSSNTLVEGDYIFDNDDDDDDDENEEPQSQILSTNAGVEQPRNGAAGSNGWLSNLILHLFGPVVNDPARLTSNDSILQRQRRMSSVMTYMLQSLWGEAEDS